MGYSALLGDVERCVMGVNVKIEKEVLDYLADRFFEGIKPSVGLTKRLETEIVFSLGYKYEDTHGEILKRNVEDLPWYKEKKNFISFLEKETGFFTRMDLRTDYSPGLIFLKFSFDKDNFKKLIEAVKKMMEQDKFEEIKLLVDGLFNLKSVTDCKGYLFSICENYLFYDFCIKNNISVQRTTDTNGSKIVTILFNCNSDIDCILNALREEKKRRVDLLSGVNAEDSNLE